jgi:hypothetical protein
MRLTPGTKVIFGTENGAQTQGTVIKINRARAKVRQDEARNSRPVGTIWGVPASLMRTSDGKFITNDWEIVDQKPTVGFKLPAAGANDMPSVIWMQTYEHEIHILSVLYANLSPENLTGDGELGITEVRARRAEIDRKMRAVEVLMGRPMSEDVTFRCIEELEKMHKRDHQPI